MAEIDGAKGDGYLLPVQQTIPTLSLSDFLDGGEATRSAFVDGLHDALASEGFFALEDHGVDPLLIARAYEVAARFFSLDAASKRACERPALGGQRGFTRFGREHAKDHPVADLKEFFHVGRERAEAPNVFPAEVADFEPTMMALYAALETCGLHLLDACSLALGQPSAWLRGAAEGGESILRVIHYPPVPDGAHPAALRAAPHEDINLLTLLCESTDEGLELRRGDGQWLPVHALRGQIIVDSGDMFANLTNGLFRSTTHRVVNAGEGREPRYSMPFFLHPRGEADLTPHPSAVARTGGVARYPATTADAYLRRRLAEIGLGGAPDDDGA